MFKIDNTTITKNKSINIEFFFNQIKDKFNISLLSKQFGFDRIIKDQNLHRPGLALAGFIDLFTNNRVQIFGNTEVRYLSSLDKNERINSLERIFKFDIPCLLLTDNNKPFEEMLELAEKYGISIFGSELSTTKLTYLLSDFLDDQFSPRISLHGSFVDVYGVGLLFVGKSGIGKSEVALDLVERGHRLVADDVVIFTKKGEGILMGAGTEMVQHFMEVRGVGIIDVRSMFGIRAIRFQKRLEVIIELEEWNDKHYYDRTGLDNVYINVMDVKIPHVKLPIVPGKNITVIAEVLSLNYLLKHYGYNPAKIMQEKLNQRLMNSKRAVDYFEHDFE